MDASAEHVERRMGVWQLAWPAVLTNLLQSTVGVIDIKVVGSVGAGAVAAATAGHRLFFVLQATLMAVGVGTTALVARVIGALQRDEAARVVSNSLALGCAIAVVTSVFGVAA